MTRLQKKLNRMDACHKAIRWAGKRTYPEAWNACTRPGWLRYFLAEHYLRTGNSAAADAVRDWRSSHEDVWTPYGGFGSEVNRKAANDFRRTWPRPKFHNLV